MKVCKDCRNKVWGDGVTYLPQVCIDCKYVEVNGEKEPSNWKPRHMTNADRIRAMSDEELEEQFCGGGLCSYIQTHDSQFCDGRGSCVNCIKEWLKQPAEVDNG